MRLTLHDLRKLAASRKLAMLTCYDATFARLFDACEVDMLLIGDSLGMAIQGHDSTLPVTVDDIAYHTAAVARGAQRAWVVADLPFGSYQASPEQAYANAVRLMQAGAQMVKLEGGVEMVPHIAFLTARGVPVCGHVGLTPQHVNVLGGYRVQGRGDSAARVRADALAVFAAGAPMQVIEAVPEPLARSIAQDAAARGGITIGIGASAACQAQVLVMHDILGATQGRKARFVHDFLAETGTLEAAVRRYVAEVRSGAFPTAAQTYPDTAG